MPIFLILLGAGQHSTSTNPTRQGPQKTQNTLPIAVIHLGYVCLTLLLERGN
jgi:hypothetical protein